MVRVIDMNERSAKAKEEAQIKTMRALGAIQGIAELSRNPIPLDESQVGRIEKALNDQVSNAIRTLMEAARRQDKPHINFEL